MPILPVNQEPINVDLDESEPEVEVMEVDMPTLNQEDNNNGISHDSPVQRTTVYK